MFTGIITDIGRVAAVRRPPGADTRVSIACGYDLSTVALGASIACSGVCLTVTAIEGDRFEVDVSDETLARTAPGLWQEGAALNLERSLRVGDELGGHIVTGHVDAIGTIRAVTPAEGSTRLVIEAPPILAPLIAPKGSIAVDGVSLTVNAVEDQPDGTCHLHLNIIPHTARWTTLGRAAPGRAVNLEVDILARYLDRMRQVRTS